MLAWRPVYAGSVLRAIALLLQRLPSSSHLRLIVAAASLLLSPAAHAAERGQAIESYEAKLDPVAFQALTRASVGGSGTIVARLNGNELVVAGAFDELPAPASRATLFRGLGIGVPGEPIFPLATTAGKSGRIEGKSALDAALIAALRQGHLYIRIDTTAAPDGSAWGWLLPL
jgi:hypothetical protein